MIIKEVGPLIENIILTKIVSRIEGECCDNYCTYKENRSSSSAQVVSDFLKITKQNIKSD